MTTTTTTTKRLEEHFEANLRKGIVLSAAELEAFCRKKRIDCLPAAELKQLRYRWKYSAMHSGTRKRKPLHYMGAAIEKVGNVFVDLAHFRPDLVVANRQCKYFILGVDSLSQKMACYPVPHKTRRWWRWAVLEMKAKDFPYMSTMYSDRDVAVMSDEFQGEMKREHGVDCVQMLSRNKSFLAEQGIRRMKESLSLALKFGRQNWVDLVPTIVARWNRLLVKGTSIRREQVDKSNYWEVLAQRYGAKDPTPLTNTSVMSEFSPQLAAKLFRHKVGAKVMLSKDANFKLKTGAFDKKSVAGAFGPGVFVVKRQMLKSNSKLFLSPVYELEGLPGKYYATELIPATFADSTEDDDDDDDDDDGDELAEPRPKRTRKTTDRRE